MHRVFIALSWLALAATPAASSTVTVPADGDLQQALNAARPGDSVLLTSGATYVGNFVLPPRMGTDARPIVLRTEGSDAVPTGARISPTSAVRLAKIRSPNGSPALRTSMGTRLWRIELVEFMGNRGGAGDIVTLGEGAAPQTSLRDIPSELIFDRVYIHGDPRDGQKRGIALNSGRTVISNSYISDIKARGVDSQAICGWNGPGPYAITNNYLEAAGENVMFGGADPSVPDLTPTDIVIRDNVFSKPLAWKDSETGWQVKNLFELKNARRVTVEKNLFERNWAAGQSGYAILMTVRNQDGGCRWCQVEDVQFRQNIVRDVAAGVQITGIDNQHPSRQTLSIVVANNLFQGIDSQKWGGDGYFLQMTDNPRAITVDHNTVIQGQSSGMAKIEGTVQNFVFTNNLIRHGSYGIIATDHGVGNDTIRSSLPGAVIMGNVISGGNSGAYPPGNLFPSEEEFRRQFLDFNGQDYRLVPENQWREAGRTARSPGADVSVLQRGKNRE